MSLTTAKYKAVQNQMIRVFKSQARAATPFYPLVATIAPSDGESEDYGWVGAMPGMREWIGDRQWHDLRAADYTLKNKTFESSLALEKEKVDDDRHGFFENVMRALADEATYHPDELLFFNLINSAESLACFDGQFFYDTDHSWGDSGTQSNDLGYTVASTSAVTTTEFKASFHQALEALLGFKNDRGKYLVRPRIGKLGNLVARVPLALYETAVKSFEQIYISGGESNFHLEKPQVVVIQYMGAGNTGGSDVKWDLDYTGGILKPFIFQARKPLRIQSKGADDNEFKDLKFMTDARYNVGFGAWWTSVRTTFST